MKCPGCGCNYMDDDKYCPMCELPNNALARAAHRLRRARHDEAFKDCDTTTCAHPKDSSEKLRRQPDRQTAAADTPESVQRWLDKQRGSGSSAAPARRAPQSAGKKAQPTPAVRIIKIVIGIFVAVNFLIPLLFGLLEFLFYNIF